MHSYITGANGLVGSAIEKNTKNNFKLSNKIENLNDFKQFLTQNKIETIYHTAAKVGGVLANFENKIEFCLKNTKLNNIVFEAAYDLKIKNLINYSSTCVFPDQSKENIKPLTEDMVFNGPPHFSNDGYAYAKRLMQYLCSEARKEGFNYFTIVPTNVFGPNDNYNLQNAHVIPALIHKCYLAKENNEDLVVWGNGEPLREFIFSEDLAKISIMLAEKNKDYDSIIVSSGEEFSIRECAEAIASAMKFNNNLIFDHTKPNGQYRKPTDISLLKSIIGDFQFTDFHTAIQISVDWFLENKDKIRKGRI